MHTYERIKHFLLIAFTGVILLILNGCNSTNIAILQCEIDSIATRWVPDRREGICNISVKTGDRNSLILSGETNNPDSKNEIINTLGNRGISLTDSIITLPDTINNEQFLGLVTLSVINMRKLPEHSSELVSQAILGTPVIILKNENSWILIQTPDRYIAWTEESSVKSMSRSEMEGWRKANRVIFLENTGLIYSSIDESGIIGDLVAGSILEKTGDSNGYSRVVLPDGREGYVRNKMVKEFDSWRSGVTCSGDKICNVASEYIGLPYLWGGTSAKAFDCSGFVQTVYFLNGLILSRDASLQARHGLLVDLSDGFGKLQSGDLLFFGSKSNNVSHVTHVAIYKGDSEFIHSSGRVMENSLDSAKINYSSYRLNSLLAARRISGIDNDPGILQLKEHPWY